MKAWLRRRRGWIVSALSIVGALGLWAVVIEPGRLVERDATLLLPQWSPACDGLRVDVVADTHTGSFRNGVDNLDRIVGRLLASDSDAVLLAGDYVILSVLLGTWVPPDVIASHLQPLAARKPVYAVLGNHDWWKDGAAMRRALENAGITVLENHAVRTRLGACELWIAGIGDLWEGRPQVERAFAIIDDDAPVIALTHNPDLFPELPARASLVVSGHTHGGQVKLPLVGRPIVPSKLGDRYAAGEVVEGGRHLFVSPGIGTSILPVRFGVPPEISRLTLRAAPPARAAAE